VTSSHRPHQRSLATEATPDKELEMAVKHAAGRRRQCPLYCTINHKHETSRHAHLIAEVDVPSEHTAVTVNVVRRDKADWVELATGTDGDKPAVTRLTADEARTLRDALNVAVVLLDRA
jgi:hypothetical protein